MSCKLYSVRDNLAKLLQSTKMLAIKGKNFTDLIIETIEKMRNNSGFTMFCQVVKELQNQLKQLMQLLVLETRKNKQLDPSVRDRLQETSKQCL